ncbi:unnamed protein product [Spirodela intermedia]|uniref:Uncharacterized protein n=1 Tax=Spirodela intermedia TaxID=51605 RepID=A0A7I8JQR6_SPIIN|nr:unnamed protein product [Spirodela intermedia]CAA6672480.1 unnamed protein product [Spirodela intermedia]
MGAKLRLRRPEGLLLAAHFLFLISVVVAAPSLKVKPLMDLQERAELQLDPAAGPESIAFDGGGGGPYTGVSDGSVLRWNNVCGGPYETMMEGVCGRPLGLQFEKATGDLYIADAYFGLLMVATEAEGQPFSFTNGVDIDQDEGIVYFTDSSTRFHRRRWRCCCGGWPSQRRGHGQDGAFLLVAETTNRRVLRYWLRGQARGKSTSLRSSSASRTTSRGRQRGSFGWRSEWAGTSSRRGELRATVMCPVAMRLAADGAVVEVVEDCTAAGAVSEVEERSGTLWLGSVVRPYVEVYSL